MNGSEHDPLLETLRRRRLTAEEEARLQTYWLTHPEAQAAWEEDMSLNHLLEQLPDVAVSSNFTAQVLQVVDREHRPQPERTRSLLRRWLPSVNLTQKVTAAAVLVCVAGLSWQHHRLSVRAELADSVAKVSSVAGLPSLEILQDFDAINRLSQVSQADLDLLAALQ